MVREANVLNHFICAIALLTLISSASFSTMQRIYWVCFFCLYFFFHFVLLFFAICNSWVLWFDARRRNQKKITKTKWFDKMPLHFVSFHSVLFTHSVRATISIKFYLNIIFRLRDRKSYAYKYAIRLATDTVCVCVWVCVPSASLCERPEWMNETRN